MIIKFNNVSFDCFLELENKLVITSELDQSSYDMFEKWEDNTRNQISVQYKKDMKFILANQRGSLRGCYPMFNLNRNKVMIYFDAKLNDVAN